MRYSHRFLYLFIFGPNTAIIIVYFCGHVTPRWRIGSLLLMKVSRDNRKAFRKNWSWRYTSTQKKTESKHREREREKQKSNNILQREESRKRQKIKHIYGGKKSVCVCVYLTLFLLCFWCDAWIEDESEMQGMDSRALQALQNLCFLSFCFLFTGWGI